MRQIKFAGNEIKKKNNIKKNFFELVDIVIELGRHLASFSENSRFSSPFHFFYYFDST